MRDEKEIGQCKRKCIWYRCLNARANVLITNMIRQNCVRSKISRESNNVTLNKS